MAEVGMSSRNLFENNRFFFVCFVFPIQLSDRNYTLQLHFKRLTKVQFPLDNLETPFLI